MADQTQTTYSRQGGRTITGYRGTQAGKSFPTTAEASEAADWEQYKVEKKLSFAASKTQHKAAFEEWRKARARKAGQAAGVQAAPASTTQK